MGELAGSRRTTSYALLSVDATVKFEIISELEQVSLKVFMEAKQ